MHAPKVPFTLISCLVGQIKYKRFCIPSTKIPDTELILNSQVYMPNKELRTASPFYSHNNMLRYSSDQAKVPKVFIHGLVFFLPV